VEKKNELVKKIIKIQIKMGIMKERSMYGN